MAGPWSESKETMGIGKLEFAMRKVVPSAGLIAIVALSCSMLAKTALQAGACHG